ncbi:hypothetical protein ACDP63_17940 [Paracoccus sp. P2]|uniref:hypothetical protein n=1 Tax=Paracoccus sp. P2 TaxID=3248840 RepID=UPI00391F162F
MKTTNQFGRRAFLTRATVGGATAAAGAALAAPAIAQEMPEVKGVCCRTVLNPTLSR